jgi:metal transporter CNNM
LVVDLERRPSQVSYHTISDVGDLPVIVDEDEFETLPQRRGQARSGSITEQIVDVPGGLRKMVLETTSSSEDAEHEAQEAEAAYMEDTGSTSRPGAEGGGAKKGDESKAKKKKRRKKHGAKRGGGDAEGTPLLGGS